MAFGLLPVGGLVEPFAAAVQHLVGTEHQMAGMARRHPLGLQLAQRFGNLIGREAGGAEAVLDLLLIDRGRLRHDADAGTLQHGFPGGGG